jgi:hypothetical protein
MRTLGGVGNHFRGWSVSSERGGMSVSRIRTYTLSADLNWSCSSGLTNDMAGRDCLEGNRAAGGQ